MPDSSPTLSPEVQTSAGHEPMAMPQLPDLRKLVDVQVEQGPLATAMECFLQALSQQAQCIANLHREVQAQQQDVCLQLTKLREEVASQMQQQVRQAEERNLQMASSIESLRSDLSLAVVTANEGVARLEERVTSWMNDYGKKQEDTSTVVQQLQVAATETAEFINQRWDMAVQEVVQVREAIDQQLAAHDNGIQLINTVLQLDPVAVNEGLRDPGAPSPPHFIPVVDTLLANVKSLERQIGDVTASMNVQGREVDKKAGQLELQLQSKVAIEDFERAEQNWAATLDQRLKSSSTDLEEKLTTQWTSQLQGKASLQVVEDIKVMVEKWRDALEKQLKVTTVGLEEKLTAHWQAEIQRKVNTDTLAELERKWALEIEKQLKVTSEAVESKLTAQWEAELQGKVGPEKLAQMAQDWTTDLDRQLGELRRGLDAKLASETETLTKEWGTQLQGKVGLDAVEQLAHEWASKLDTSLKSAISDAEDKLNARWEALLQTKVDPEVVEKMEERWSTEFDTTMKATMTSVHGLEDKLTTRMEAGLQNTVSPKVVENIEKKWNGELDFRLREAIGYMDAQLASKAEVEGCKQTKEDLFARMARTVESRTETLKETVQQEIRTEVAMQVSPLKQSLDAMVDANVRQGELEEERQAQEEKMTEAILGLQNELDSLKKQNALGAEEMVQRLKVLEEKVAELSVSIVHPEIHSRSSISADVLKIEHGGAERPIGRRGRKEVVPSDAPPEVHQSDPLLSEEALRDHIQQLQPTGLGQWKWLSLLRQIKQQRPLTQAQEIQMQHFRKSTGPLSAEEAHICDLLQQLEQGRPLTELQAKELDALVEMVLSGRPEPNDAQLASQLTALAEAVECIQWQLAHLMITELKPSLDNSTLSASADNSATTLRYRCLSCNRPAGRFTERPERRAGGHNEFPPSPIFVSSPVDSAPPMPPSLMKFNGANSLGAVSSNTVARRKLLSYFEWLATKGDDGLDPIAAKPPAFVPRPPPQRRHIVEPLGTTLGRDGRQYRNIMDPATSSIPLA